MISEAQESVSSHHQLHGEVDRVPGSLRDERFIQDCEGESRTMTRRVRRRVDRSVAEAHQGAAEVPQAAGAGEPPVPRTLSSRTDSVQSQPRVACEDAQSSREPGGAELLGTQVPESQCLGALGQPDWTLLPESALGRVFSFLDVWQLAKVSCVCSTWRSTAASPALWKTSDLRAHVVPMRSMKGMSTRFGPLMQSLLIRGHSAVAAAFLRANDLRSLYLDVSLNLSDSTLGMLVARLGSNLQSLSLVDCSRLCSSSLETVAVCCPALRELYVSGMEQVERAALQALSSHCPRLRSLSIVDCADLDEKGLSSLKQVQYLSLAGSKLNFSAGAFHLWRLPLLRGLDVSRTDISVEEVNLLLSYNSLRVLCTLGCPSLEQRLGRITFPPEPRLLLHRQANIKLGLLALALACRDTTPLSSSLFVKWSDKAAFLASFEAADASRSAQGAAKDSPGSASAPASGPSASQAQGQTLAHQEAAAQEGVAGGEPVLPANAGAPFQAGDAPLLGGGAFVQGGEARNQEASTPLRLAAIQALMSDVSDGLMNPNARAIAEALQALQAAGALSPRAGAGASAFSSASMGAAARPTLAPFVGAQHQQGPLGASGPDAPWFKLLVQELKVIPPSIAAASLAATSAEPSATSAGAAASAGASSMGYPASSPAAELFEWSEGVLVRALRALVEMRDAQWDEFWATQGVPLVVLLLQSSQPMVREQAALAAGELAVVELDGAHEEDAAAPGAQGELRAQQRRAAAIMGGPGLRCLIRMAASDEAQGCVTEAARVRTAPLPRTPACSSVRHIVLYCIVSCILDFPLTRSDLDLPARKPRLIH